MESYSPIYMNADLYLNTVATNTTTNDYIVVGSDSKLYKRTLGTIVTKNVNDYLSTISINMPDIFNQNVTSVTPTSNTLNVTIKSQNKGLFLASPIGVSGVPTFRSISSTDVPTLTLSHVGLTQTMLDSWNVAESNAITKSKGSLIVSTTTTSTSNATTTNTNTYLNLVQNGASSGSSVLLKGSGAVSVSSTGGVITISGANSEYEVGSVTLLNNGVNETNRVWRAVDLSTYVNNTIKNELNFDISATSNQTSHKNYNTTSNILGRNIFKLNEYTTSDVGELTLWQMLSSFGSPIFGDSEFANGLNTAILYGSGATVKVIDDTQNSANSTSKIMEVVIQQSGACGFVQKVDASTNSTTVLLFRAKLPVGYRFSDYRNNIGTNGFEKWLTDTRGTGRWEWYAKYTQCGTSSGTSAYSNYGHVGVNLYDTTLAPIPISSTNKLTFYVSHLETYDLIKNIGTSTATKKLLTPVTINGVNFDGTQNINIDTSDKPIYYTNDTTRYFEHKINGFYSNGNSSGFPSIGGGLHFSRYSTNVDQTGFYLFNGRDENYLRYKTFNGLSNENAWEIIADRTWVTNNFTKPTDNIASATKLQTPRNFSVGLGAKSNTVSFDGTQNVVLNIDEIYDGYVTWGGRNWSGLHTPIDAGLNGDLGANRFAFIPPENITIEYSKDGGVTWSNYSSLSAENKTNLCTNVGTSVYIGGGTHKATDTWVGYMVRVTINAGIGSTSVYTQLRKFHICVSTNGSANPYVTVEARTNENYTNNVDTWLMLSQKNSISGWSGYNVINIPTITFGTTNGQSREIRFTFGQAGQSTQYTGLRVLKIMGFGGMGWTTPSSMAKNGHLYSYDAYQNAIFPNVVIAKKFIKVDGTSDEILLANGDTILRNELSPTNFYLPLSGGTMTGSIVMKNNSIEMLSRDMSTVTSDWARNTSKTYFADDTTDIIGYYSKSGAFTYGYIGGTSWATKNAIRWDGSGRVQIGGTGTNLLTNDFEVNGDSKFNGSILAKGLGNKIGSNVSNTTLPLAGSVTGVGLTVCNASDLYGTKIGSLSNGKGFIQQGRVDGTNTVYELQIQPNGGVTSFGTGGVETNSYIKFLVNDYGIKDKDDAIRFRVASGGTVISAPSQPIYFRPSGTDTTTTNQTIFNVDGTVVFSNSITATSFIKSGGTSAQFLKADGSIDSTAYTTDVKARASLITSTSATGVSNVATTNTNTYMNIVQNSTSVGSSSQITGVSGVSVSSDTNGKLTITGTVYVAGNGLTLTGSTFSIPIEVVNSGNTISNIEQSTNGLKVTKSNSPKMDNDEFSLVASNIVSGVVTVTSTKAIFEKSVMVFVNGVKIPKSKISQTGTNTIKITNSTLATPIIIGDYVELEYLTIVY